MKETTLTIDCIEDFRQWLSDKGRSENTMNGYSADLKMFFRELSLTSCPVSQFPQMAAAWMKISKGKVAVKTIQRRATTMKVIGKYLGIDAVLEDYKLPVAAPGKPHPLPGLLQDLLAMLALCQTQEQRCLLALLGLEGMRLHEALDMTPAHFNMQDMTIKFLGKGGREREIPITTRAWDVMSHRVIYCTVENRERLITYSDRGARNLITSLGEKANLARPVSSHDLRATFATLTYRETRDIRLVQQWLGHTSVETTQLYIGMPIEDMRRGAAF